MQRQATRSRIGAVVKFGDCLVNLFPGRGPDMRFGIDDARDCFDGDAGKVGNVKYGSFSHYGWISVAWMSGKSLK